MAHVATITIDHTKVPGDLTDYVGLIVPDGSAGYSALYALCLEGGGDIRLFKSDDTTELAREIVTFSVTDETGEIHYKYSGTLSSSVDTDIHVYADGSSADYAVTATYGRNNVWTDYSGVFHQQMSSGDAIDSAGNTNLTVDADITYGSVGQIGDATTHPGDSNVDIKKTSTTATTTEPVTIQAWARPDIVSGARSLAYIGSDGGEHGILFVGSAAWALSQNGSFPSAKSGSIISANTYYMVHGVFSSNASREIYVDGVSQDTDTSSITVGAGSGLAIGGRFLSGTQSFDGRLDGIRFRDSVLSANWITTEYNNQNSYSTFYSVAAVAGSSAAQAARRGAVMMM